MSAISLHLPVLTVLLPLLAAPICAFLPAGRRGDSAGILAHLVTVASFLVALWLYYTVRRTGVPIEYAFGGWAPPLGIGYRIDTINALILVLVSGIGAFALPYGLSVLPRELPARKLPAFYAVYLLCLSGMMGMASSSDVFNIYVFIEIASLSSYALIAMGSTRGALLSAFQYLILGSIGATLYLIGIGLLYMMTGTLSIADLAVRLPAVADSHTVRAGLAFVCVGLLMKAAVFPFHGWLVGAYTHAPHFTSIFLSATMTKVVLYILVRFIVTVAGISLVFDTLPAGALLQGCAAAAILFGSLAAVYQTRLKSLLAYSSVAQIGYMVLGISLGSAAGMEAGLAHMLNHAATKAALFMAIASLAVMIAGTRGGQITLDDIAGLGRRMPLTALAFVLAGLSLIGVPLTAGFVSKWLLVRELLAQASWGLLLVLLTGSLLAVIYVWRVAEALYFRAPSPSAAAAKDPPLGELTPLLAIVAVCVYLGVDTRPATGTNVAGAIAWYDNLNGEEAGAVP